MNRSEECHFGDSAKMKIDPNLGLNNHNIADQRCLKSNQNFVLFLRISMFVCAHR